MSTKEINDLQKNIKTLTEKVEEISSKISSMETLLFRNMNGTNLNSATSNNTSSYDDDDSVETFSNQGEEDMLIPQDIFTFTNQAGILETVKVLVKDRLASADDISYVTGRDRAVESAYLNELVKDNKCRKMRIGRKTFFYINSKSHLDPFVKIPKKWRNFFLAFFKTHSFNEDPIILNREKLIKSIETVIFNESKRTMKKITNDDTISKNETEEKKEIEEFNQDLLTDIKNHAPKYYDEMIEELTHSTQIIKEHNVGSIIFIKENWLSYENDNSV